MSSWKVEKGTCRGKEYFSTRLLDLVYTYLCGLTRTRNIQGESYFMLLIDSYSRKSWVAFLREKEEALEKFKILKAEVENEVDTKIKCLRYNRGGEFTSDEFNNFCEKYGIRRQLFTSRTP